MTAVLMKYCGPHDLVHVDMKFVMITTSVLLPHEDC